MKIKLHPEDKTRSMEVDAATAEDESGCNTALLVVDDRKEKRLAMQAVLEELHLPIVLAESGTDALRHLLREDFSVILLDINMPEMDGIELAGIIRSRRRSAKTPIIFYSADAETVRQMEPVAYELGAVDLLVAPVPAEVLRSKVAVFADFHRRLVTTRRIAGERERMLRAEAARAEAERASAAKDHFLAMLSHELRTPLSPVLNTIELLMDTPEYGPELRAQLDTIRRNVVLEARLIDDLLDLTKVSRGKVSLRLEAVDVHESIQSVLGICQAEMDEKHITVKVPSVEAPAVVRADSARLKQILWNLIRNAVKYSSPHGVIDISTSRGKRGHLCIHVKDAGCGISPELLPNIFEAFRQGMHTTGGLGLGLAITRSLVELHGGTIEARSEGLGCGAIFSVCLLAVAPGPLPTGGSSAKDQPGLPVTPKRRTACVLLVEDHADTRQTLERVLRHRGYSVVTAADMAQALELTRARRFDIIISDIGLPDGTGCDFLRQVPEKDRPYAIALSGYGMEEDIASSLTAGFAKHLTKPVDVGELDAMIQAFLAGRGEG